MTRDGPYNATTYSVQRMQQRTFGLRHSVSGRACYHDKLARRLM
jgi:hypothetical protein